MTQQEALDLAARIKEQERHIAATVEPINKYNWRLRLVFRPGSPDALKLTAGTPKEWQAIKAMWASLPVRVGV
jgi:hypothetical protein